MVAAMQCAVHESAAWEWQELSVEWYGGRVCPPFEFHLQRTAEELVLRARRAAPAVVHPAAAPGVFQEELWRYDVVELFIATADARRYLEFNLCPNGAWWAAGFTEPRVKLAGFDARSLRPALHAEMQPGGWSCSAALPLAALRPWGWLPEGGRLAACAVLCREGEYTYLTSCEQRAGKPDFHRPRDWEPARLAH